MASEAQQAVPRCRDRSCPDRHSPRPGLGVLLGLGMLWGSLRTPRSPPPLAGQRLPHPLNLRLQGREGSRRVGGALGGVWEGSLCPMAMGGGLTCSASRLVRSCCSSSLTSSRSLLRGRGGGSGGAVPSSELPGDLGDLFRVGHPSPSSPSPLTGAGLASGPRGCAGTGPRPSGPPGPAAAPGPAPRRGDGGRARRRAAPSPPRPYWAAAGPAPGGAWPWGGSAWPWSPAGH